MNQALHSAILGLVFCTTIGGCALPTSESGQFEATGSSAQPLDQQCYNREMTNCTGYPAAGWEGATYGCDEAYTVAGCVSDKKSPDYKVNTSGGGKKTRGTVVIPLR